MPGDIPKDHGWAWMCNLGSCLSMFFVIGAFKSLGILFVEFIDLYETSSGITAWVMGLSAAGMSLLSPVASALSQQYSNRRVVMVGACFSVAAPLICVVAPNIYFIVVVFGLCNGIGNALMFTPSLIIVSQYFEKRRSLANGFTMAGGSLGQLIIPLLLNYWLKKYALHGTLLLYAGLFMHGLIAGALMRPVGFYARRKSKHSSQVAASYKDGVDKVQVGMDDAELLGTSGDTMRGAFSERQLNCTAKTTQRARTYSEGDQGRLCSGVIAPPSGGSLRCMGDHLTSTGSLYIAPYQPIPTDMIAAEMALRKMSYLDDDDRNNSLPPLPLTSWYNLVAKLCGMYQWGLLRNPLFVIYVLAICFGNVGYVDTILFMPPLANDLGVDRDLAAMLMVTIGLSDLVSRLIGGWMADHIFIRRNFLAGLLMAIMGLICLLCVALPSVTSLFVLSVTIGTCGGLYATIYPVILIDYLGLAAFPKAFGMTVMFMGLTNVALPSLLGKLSDVTGSYRLSYVICGVMMTVSAVFFYVEPCVQRLQRKSQSPDGAGARPMEETVN
ncbi:Monocarboxylate transporter 5 [Lamellibrachia satsuma]|nr:Monocarboxylate transporter 5 [Lamellibrachia satsuma]